MRFTKIPLIATLMAVALSLLIVLPGLAQTGDRTDGQQTVGNVRVGVFDNIADAQQGKLVASTQTDRFGNNPFIPVTGTISPISGVTDNQHLPGDPAYMKTPQVSPQDTSFGNTLYASNRVSAYNTVVINFTHPQIEATGFTADPTCVVVDGAAGPDATYTATVRNTRSTDSITIELVHSGVTGDAGNYQAFFKVVPEDIAPFDHDSNADTDGLPYRQHGGPTWCADTTANVPFDVNDNGTIADDERVAKETVATSAVDNPVDMARTTANSGVLPAQQEIATIFAKHGDRLTVTTSSGAGLVDLVVDGDGPEFTAVTPADNAVTRSSRLSFSFEVRDDDSGLRHDGESVISADGDFEEINPDGDQNLETEPLSEDTSGSPVQRNGGSQDINVNIKANPRDDNDATAYDEISASGTWRLVGNRAGVAYAFTASGAGRSDNEYLYQLTAKDRAGNMSMTDANTDTRDSNEPFVFRVDDEDPVLTEVRTGIGYNTANNTEKVDRSYVALTFGGGDGGSHGLGQVDTSNITVVGHDIVGVIHPSKAPRINRGDSPVDPKPAKVDAPPRVVAKPGGTDITGGFADVSNNDVEAASTPLTTGDLEDGTLTDGTTAFVASDRTTVLTTDAECDFTTNPAGTTDTDTTAGNTDVPDAIDLAICRWTQYNAYVAANSAYETYVEQLDQYMDENPGTDIEKASFVEPRARVYLELASDLDADATPDVVVVGGAVYDLAGNTNEADTVRAKDWIAPSLTVTVTGTENDRPVANEDGSFTVDVRSDEDMRRRPEVYFVTLLADEVMNDDGDVTGYENYRIGTASKATPLTQQEDENHWARKYRVSSLPDSNESGVRGVIVLGEDGTDNAGATAGWDVLSHQNSGPPASDHDLTPAKMNDAGLLLEIDLDFNGGTTTGLGSVTPRSGGNVDVTESANPFVKLEFAAEKSEYNIGTFKDSHDKVTVTEITLDGDDAQANLNRVSATAFSLITRDLAVGDYTVEYTAEDDAGNEYEGEFEFEVKARQAYSVSVQPGWNLISLPATPLDSAIESVLAGKELITPVLGYQDGDWVTAVQEAGTWRGTLTEIVGGYGYWVHAGTFSKVSTMLAEVDPAATLPTVPVSAGWNLLGVLDIFQNAAGMPPGAPDNEGNFAAANYEADNYLNSIPWRVAYTYDTDESLWVKTVPDDGDDTAGSGDDPGGEILNGNGYWVWSATPSTLVP